MSDSAKFKKAAAIVQSLPKEGPIQPTDDEKLFFYAHFKQATDGDAHGAAPGLFDFVGKAKRAAWEKLKGTSAEAAADSYVDKLLEILKGVDDESSMRYIAEIEAA